MVSLYARRIIMHTGTFDKVPKKFKEAVKVKLLEFGYDTDGNPISENDENQNEEEEAAE